MPDPRERPRRRVALGHHPRQRRVQGLGHDHRVRGVRAETAPALHVVHILVDGDVLVVLLLAVRRLQALVHLVGLRLDLFALALRGQQRLHAEADLGLEVQFGFGLLHGDDMKEGAVSESRNTWCTTETKNHPSVVGATCVWVAIACVEGGERTVSPQLFYRAAPAVDRVRLSPSVELALRRYPELRAELAKRTRLPFITLIYRDIIVIVVSYPCRLKIGDVSVLLSRTRGEGILPY